MSLAPAPGPLFVQEVSTNRRAAIVRTGSERERRDLFADRDEADGHVNEPLLPPPSSCGVGARNETSVLFRVDQLANVGVATGTARKNTPEPARTPLAEPDDEGVIDLKALSNAPPATTRAPVAPLFSEPPVAFEVNGTVPYAAARPGGLSRLHIIGAVAAAAAFFLVVGLGVALAFGGEEPVKHAAVVLVPPAPPPVVIVPAEPPPAAVVASTSEGPGETPSTIAKGKKTKGKGSRGVSKGGAMMSKAPAAPKAPKAANPCGCNGDFNCILACTAKGGK